MTKCLNKNAADIQYNILNLPSQITFEDSSSLSHIYDVNGVSCKALKVSVDCLCVACLQHISMHYSCVVKYEMQLIRFMFTLYKPKDKWLLINFQFSTDFTNELDDSSKFYYIE